MDAESHSISQEAVLTDLAPMNNVIVHHFDQLEGHCALCRRDFSPDNEINEGFETINLCGNCKLMFLEDIETNTRDSHQRLDGGRVMDRSTESIEDLFSQQFSHLINLVRQNQYSVPISSSEHEVQLTDGDFAARVVQRTSSRTTPTGSRRWRRVLSDNESEVFDNLDSVFGESESNVSFTGYGAFHTESDAISFSVYGGESDASVDGHGFLDRETFIQPDDGSDIDGDTDIDPMHAGLNQWNLYDQEDGEWEEAEGEGSTVETTEAEGWIQDAFIRSPSENNGPINWLRGIHSPENRSIIRWRIRESRRTYRPDVFTNLEESEVQPYIGNPGDYLDSRGFEQLLEQLADTDGFRRGAPPASASFVECLPLVVISEELEKHGNLICAVCKDGISIGSEANQLPCMHLYHPSCILPWLSARNSCPLCRYELPTDDKDYEDGKRNTGGRVGIHEIEPQDQGNESSSDISSDSETDELVDVSHGRTEGGELVSVECATDTPARQNRRGGWFLFAAAPIVSLVGIVLVLWFRNPLVERREPRGRCSFPEQGQQHLGRTPMRDQRGSRSRRWWSLF